MMLNKDLAHRIINQKDQKQQEKNKKRDTVK